ncbi:MAG: ATP-binding protein [Sedimentisphaerales bacterium]
MTFSLRARLLTGIIAGMILLLTLFSLLIYVVIRSALVKQFNTSLASTALILAASVEVDGNEIDLELDVQHMPEFQRPDRPTYYQLWRHDGTVAARSPSLGMDDLLRLEGPLGTPVFQALQTRNSQPGRVVGLKFTPRLSDSDKASGRQPAKEQTLTLAVARDASGLYRQLDFIQWLLIVASGGTVALSVFIAAFVVRQGLRPLNAIAAEIASIKEDSLTARITTENVPIEVVQIKNRLNELLSRLEASFNRERRFNADVAHELRTPLTGLRSTIEVTLARTRDNDEYKRVLSDCHAIVENMQTMVNNLLTLAKLDAQQIRFHTEQIQLAELTNSCWRPFSEKALERKITYDNTIESEFTCESDPRNLSIALSNVLDNAVEYADEGGRIRTTARRIDDSMEVTVSNTGCRLTDEQVSQIFDCFWRHDSSRSDTGTHCGLGLALVQRLVRALGGNTFAELQSGGIFVVRLILPASTKKRKIL